MKKVINIPTRADWQRYGQIEDIDFDAVESIYDLQLGAVVDVMNWGHPDKMQVVGYDEPSNQVRLQWLDAYGGCYHTIQDLKRQQRRAKEEYFTKQKQTDL